jgi:hypothetical protein
MGAPDLRQPTPDADPRPRAGREEARQESSPGAPSSHSSPAAPPGIPHRVLVATHLHALRFSWHEVYEVAACVLGGAEVWTGVRLDGSGVITAGDWVTFGVLLREDHGSYPHGGPIAKVPYDLATVRTGHPGFAVIGVPGGFMAFRGSRAWPLHGEEPLGLPALNNELHAQEWEDRRLAAAAAKM